MASREPLVSSGGRRLPRGAEGWVWPWWLQRQLDPESPAWLPAVVAATNLTGHTWTVLGVPDQADRWVVDRGLLAPAGGPWSVDWWVGTDDRWHVPSREAAVRQHLLGSAPVVETAIRVAGGDVIHRTWAEARGAGSSVAGIEIDNATPTAVAVAVSLRPYGPAGLGSIPVVRFDGATLSVGSVPVIEVGEAPLHAALSDEARGDVAAAVFAGRATGSVPGRASCPDGWVTAALVWAVPPHARLQLVVPGAVAAAGRGPRRPPALAGPQRVAAGWAARVGRDVRLELPAGRVADAAGAVRAHLLLGPGGAPRPGEARWVVAAASAGYQAEATAVVDSWLGDQYRNGRLGDGIVSTGARLWALERWRRLAAPAPASAGLRGPVVRAVEHLGQAPPNGDDAGDGAGDGGWRRAGLLAGRDLLAAMGEVDAAAQAEMWAGPGAPVEVAVFAPAGRRPVDGLDPQRAVDHALRAVVGGGDPEAALDWLLEVASPTWTWPTAVHPRLRTGSHGSGHDAAVTAAVWLLLRGLLVADGVDTLNGGAATAGPVCLALLPGALAVWRGQPLEVHGLPTAVGRLSYAVRWHGPRPALLWDLEGDGPDVVLIAPALDPGWSGEGRAGEALLAPAGGFE